MENYFIEIAVSAINNIMNGSKNKYSSFQSNKNASVDDLLDTYKRQLRAKGAKKISGRESRAEVRFKYIMTVLRESHPLLSNYLLFLFADSVFSGRARMSFFKPISSSKWAPVLTDVVKFHSVGHATKKQILKSLSIIFYEMYKKTMSRSELEIHIQNLIYEEFGEEAHKSTKDFKPENYYIRSYVYPFPVFDTDRESALHQRAAVLGASDAMFAESLVKKFFWLFARKVLLWQLSNPVDAYIRQEKIKLRLKEGEK